MSKHLQIAYQLYSAREEVANDMEGTLLQLADMGYQGVEFAGFFDKSPKEIRKLLKKAGLAPVGSHVSIQKIREDPHGVIEYHKDIDCSAIIVPALAEEERPGAPGFAAVLNTFYTFGRQCRKNDLTLLYHNHDFEFVELSGRPALDFLFDAIPAQLLQTEIDTCWVKHAGYDPAAYIRRYAHRCPLVHLHDYEMIPGENGPETLFKPLGCGCQDVPALVQAARESHAHWLVVEQDDSPERPALEAARMSVDYLRTLL